MKRTGTSIVIILFLLCGFSLFAEQPKNDELELKISDIKTFTAKFQQIFTSKLTKKVNGDKTGDIYYEAPGFMRFDYRLGKQLSEQVFLTSASITFIDYGQKSVIKKKGQGEYGEYLVFLRGVPEIKKKFSIKKGDSSIAKKVGIKIKDSEQLYKLTPIKTISNLKYLFLILQDGEVRSVVVIDELSNINQFIFSDIVYNGKIEKNLFTPVIPQGFKTSDL